MIVLDTNVVSELMRSAPNRSVVRWLDEQPAQSIWITSITVFESRLGLALLPAGRRRSALEQAFERLLAEDLERRILPFDTEAAVQAARLGSARRRQGHVVDVRDTQIAGIAMARRATLATRNTKHFSDLPTPIVDPWNEGGTASRSQ